MEVHVVYVREDPPVVAFMSKSEAEEWVANRQHHPKLYRIEKVSLIGRLPNDMTDSVE